MDRGHIEWIHRHETEKKSADWFWVVGIFAVAGIIIAIFLNNMLFALVLALSAIALSLSAYRHGVEETECHVSTQGIRVGEEAYPYQTLQSFYIDRSVPEHPVLRFRSERILSPLVTVHIPEEYADPIEEYLIVHIPREIIEEPLTNRVSDFIGL